MAVVSFFDKHDCPNVQKPRTTQPAAPNLETDDLVGSEKGLLQICETPE